MITKKDIGFRNVNSPQLGTLSSKLPASKPKADSNETELISEKVHKRQALEQHGKCKLMAYRCVSIVSKFVFIMQHVWKCYIDPNVLKFRSM